MITLATFKENGAGPASPWSGRLWRLRRCSQEWEGGKLGTCFTALLLNAGKKEEQELQQ